MPRILIRMVSSAGTGHFYTTSKNAKTKTEKLELKKYDPKARKHVKYKESKICPFDSDCMRQDGPPGWVARFVLERISYRQAAGRLERLAKTGDTRTCAPAPG